MIESEAELGGRRLRGDEALPFRCHPGLACFNSCCRDKRLTLLPYDALRLARALRSSSADLLERWAELEIEPASGWPTLRIRLAADGRCPFLRETGCGVYPDRPTCCRIYPLARALRLDRRGDPDAVFVLEATGSRCLGVGAAPAHTVESWTRDQGLAAYHAAHDRAARLFRHPARPRPLALSPAGVHAVVLALYNADVFRQLVGRPGFAAESGFEDARVARALASDEALLELGQDWLARRLFG